MLRINRAKHQRFAAHLASIGHPAIVATGLYGSAAGVTLATAGVLSAIQLPASEVQK